jgi:hypothetical protein
MAPPIPPQRNVLSVAGQAQREKLLHKLHRCVQPFAHDGGEADEDYFPGAARSGAQLALTKTKDPARIQQIFYEY